MGLRRWLGLRKDPAFERDAIDIYGRRVGSLRVERGRDYSLVRFENERGFDYDAYREIQSIANKGKIHRVTVNPENIGHLCRLLQSRGARIDSVLCHGTRNAAEQQFFRSHLPHARILGTEISDTAESFPMTIQWDFHDVKPEWVGAFDVVFSNSWDHSYDPDKLFPAWLSCVAPGGTLALEWNRSNAPQRGFGDWLMRLAPLRALMSATVTDPFRISPEGLVRTLARHARTNEFAEPEIVQDLPARNWGQLFVLVRRKGVRV